MRDWKSLLAEALKLTAHQLERLLEGISHRFRDRLGWTRPVQIIPYRGYGNSAEIFLQGRVVEERKLGTPEEDDAWWENALDMYRRFRARDIGGVRVQARCLGQTQETVTDEEGYYRFHLKLQNAPPNDRLWHDVEIELLEQVREEQPEVRVTGSVMIAGSDTEFGVISDIDDTIVKTHATDLLTIARLTFFHNARTRMALPGTAAFYEALHRGSNGQRLNPFFYISSSAWNLYDLFVDFLELNSIPAGPVLLRDLGIDKTKFLKTGHEHKLDKIRHILETFPDLPFLLVGDEGQKDPSLYEQITHECPGRIRAIYIRDLRNKHRDEEIARLATELQQLGVDLLLIEDTTGAAEHAAANDWIGPHEVERVRQDCNADLTDRDAAERILRDG
ncbi:MAG: DUF2183 domain-containing protein [Planctomycetes bacterium]|nr:DUF2183 domain-containing protein [Planctomycetota bacterium]